MRVNFRLRAAINQYFAHRERCSNGSFASAEVKARCVKALNDEAKKAGMWVAVVPGTIILSKGNRQVEIKAPVWMDEQTV